MGITKTEGFTATQNKLAILAKAIGHPARIAIIEYLLKRDVVNGQKALMKHFEMIDNIIHKEL